MEISTSAIAKKIVTWLRVNPSRARRYRQLLVGLLGILFMAACKEPVAGPTPADPTKPGSSTVTQPDGTTTSPGSTTTPPTDSTRAYRKVKISWSEDDYQEIRYDSTGLPVQYASQYVNNLGTGSVQRAVYQLKYDAEKRLTRADAASGNSSTYMVYQYTGHQVTKTSATSIK